MKLQLCAKYGPGFVKVQGSDTCIKVGGSIDVEAGGNGKREGDWPCNHQSTLPVERFQADEALPDIQRRCRCTMCGWRRADLRPDYSVQRQTRSSVGWMIPPR